MNKKCANMCNSSALDMECEHDISCFQKIAGTLTGEEIMLHKLVSPEKNTPSDSVKPTTFDLSLGEGHYVYSGGSLGEKHRWQLVFIGTDERMEQLNGNNAMAEQYRRQSVNKMKTLTVPAYGSALIQLNETVDTYTVAEEKKLLVVGRFDLKLSNVHKGLISQQATQVEPYYKGKLFCFIHNLSNMDIDLKYGQKIATIEFSYVSCFCNTEKREEIIKKLREMNDDKYKEQSFCSDNGIDEVRYFRAHERLPEDCGLLGLNDRFLKEIESDEIVKGLATKLMESEEFLKKVVNKIGNKLLT